MISSLGRLEVCFYFYAWIASDFYSLYHLFMYQENFLEKNKSNLTGKYELVHGWKFLSRDRDVSDIDWTTWKHYVRIAWLPLLFHFIGAEIIRNFRKSFILYWYITFTIGFVLLKFSTSQLFVIIYQPILYVLTLQLPSPLSLIVLWIVSIINLLAVNSFKYSHLIWDIVDSDQQLDEDVYLLFFSLGWCQVRCMSYCFDQIETMNVTTKKKENIRMHNLKSEIIAILSYSLYLPTLLMGPVILYSDFQMALVQEQKLGIRLKRTVVDILFMIVYSFGMDLALHYIHFLTLYNNISYVENLPSMALCGAGLWMGVQFHLKYVVMYGTSSAFARLDHIDAPPTPRCILRIHLYSHMWKHFDVGLYRFLIKYIYKPTLTVIPKLINSPTVRKSIASSVIFIFIFIWHGSLQSIFIWSVLNYIGVTLEALGSVVQKTELYAYFCTHILKTQRMEERFKAFICTPLLIMSALSNFYLFAGSEVGHVFVQRFFSECWQNILFIYFCLYTCCHVSSILSDVPSRTDSMPLKHCQISFPQ